MFIKCIVSSIFVTVLLLSTFTDVVFAQTNPIPDIQIATARDVQINFLDPIFNWMIFIIFPLAGLMALLGAYMYVTSGGNPERVSKATKLITFAAIGLIVGFFARGFPLIIRSIFPGLSS